MDVVKNVRHPFAKEFCCSRRIHRHCIICGACLTKCDERVNASSKVTIYLWV